MLTKPKICPRHARIMWDMPKLAQALGSPRRPIMFALFLACSPLLPWLLGACAEDDEDRIEAFIAAVTGEVTTERIDHVLNTYLALEQRPLSTTVLGDMRLYRAEDKPRLHDSVHQRLQRLLGSKVKILRRHVAIKDDKARVELQLFGDSVMGNVIYELSKLDKARWVMSVVRVGN